MKPGHAVWHVPVGFDECGYDKRLMRSSPLHIRIVWATTAFRCHPTNILCGILDVAGLAMHTVLEVDLEAGFAVVIFHYLVNSGRAVALCRFGVLGQVLADGNIRVE